jgi:catechol 2,3-dioxygenase-like lactoylglutathione lyase family enzyme
MDENTPAISARFAQVNVVVADMERSLAFYRLLGVELGDMPPPWDAHHRTVSNVGDEVVVEFDSAVSVGNWAPGWDQVRTGAVIGFVVDSDDAVDVLVEAVSQEGHRVIQQPHNAFFGARYALVEDPDGIGVGIMGPIDDTRRWMPDPPS